jgi:hypothetical protein
MYIGGFSNDRLHPWLCAKKRRQRGLTASCERRESRAAARRRRERRRCFLCERRRRRRIQSAMREQLKTQLRASGIARRRTEEEGAEALFPL